MGFVTLGKTGIKAQKQAFGCLPIQRISKEDAVSLLHRAYDGGMNYFDTARAYSDSEEKVGAAFAGMRDKVYIATKTGATTAEGMWKDLEESLRMLQTDYIDVYQFHNPAFCPKPGGEDGLYDAALEAKKQGKVHEVILMMDLGDLREGFWNEEDAIDAALEIEHELKNLRLAGVGVNLSCYGSVTPNKRNMQGLVSLASDIEREIGRKLDYISGGASTSAYMAMNGTMPYRINLLRLGDIGLRGETDNFAPDFLETGVMTIKAEVIECRDKPSFPVGELSVNAFGEVGHYEDRGIRRRALVAMGRVDYGNCFDLVPRMEGIEVIGASSDHTILDVEAVKDKVHVGDVLEFGIKAYGPMAYLTSSDGVHMVFKGGKQNA